MDIKKAFIRRAGMGILAAFVVLISSALSLAATTIYVNQTAATGALAVKTVDSDGTIAPASQTIAQIPNSCAKPDLFWDSDVGKLRLVGFDSSSFAVAWTGTIGVDGKFSKPTPATTLPTIDCSTVTPPVEASVVSAAIPDAIPCASYGAWSTCSGGVYTRTGQPAGCDGLLTIPCSASPGACTSWNYGSWTPASCAGGTIQTRTATGSPSGCVGMPDAATVQSCPAPTCNSFTYACGGTCTPTSAGATTGTCPAQVTSSSPAGCAGGTPLATTTCTVGVACTGYNYSAWGTCTNGSQSRTVTGYTPLSCSGTPAASSVLTQTCSTTTPGVTTLTAQNTAVRLTLASHASSLFKFTSPAGGCTGFGWIQVNLVTDSTTGGDGQVLVKSSNQLKASLPTVADYTYEFGRVGYVPGVDWTRDPNGGVFFWTFTNGGAGENVTIKNSAAYGRAFNQTDTYYVLLYNEGAVSNGYRISWKCF